MTEPEFTDLVARMRAKQREYFRTRDNKTTLREAQDLERRVDAAIVARKAQVQPDLFF